MITTLPKTCPLCSSPIETYSLSLRERIEMCNNENCLFPLDSEQFSKYIVEKKYLSESELLIDLSSRGQTKISLQSKLEVSSSNYKLGSFHGDIYSRVDIYAKDIQCLLPRRWLNELPLHLYFLTLIKTYPNFGYIPPSSHPIHSKDKRKKQKPLLSAMGVKFYCSKLMNGEIDCILFPLCIQDHWILCIISGDGIIYVYGTLTIDKKKIIGGLSGISSWAKKEFEADWEIQYFLKDKGIVDNYNYIVLVAMYAEYFCKHSSEPETISEKVKNEDPNSYRMKMINTLFSSYSLSFSTSTRTLTNSTNPLSTSTLPNRSKTTHIEETDFSSLSQPSPEGANSTPSACFDFLED